MRQNKYEAYRWFRKSYAAFALAVCLPKHWEDHSVEKFYAALNLAREEYSKLTEEVPNTLLQEVESLWTIAQNSYVEFKKQFDTTEKLNATR